MNRYVITDHGVKSGVTELQTKEIQAVFDKCKNGGGTVVIPKGRFYTAALYMHSDTTLYLEAGAELYGSGECDDYEIFKIPEGLDIRSDMELIPQQYDYKPWESYRRAIISSYGEKNISIIGEFGSVIDGQNCYDPDGEEGYRGPHAVFLTCCENVLLEGYTARHSGNFLHEANNCRGLTMRRVTCLGGSDGIHLHCTENALIEDCLFKTGDDCIAGISIKNLLVRRCFLNTSCNVFRMGGQNIRVEDTYVHGEGYYPHRKTIVTGKNTELGRTEGRHNTLHLVQYFASDTYPSSEPDDITFKNCVVENIHALLNYQADDLWKLHKGAYLKNYTLENVRFVDLKAPSKPLASAEHPLTVTLKNVSADFVESAPVKQLFMLSENSNTTIVEE